jgi:hypothetical protein
MELEAFSWNVVIVGYWNRAILTPKGVAQRLFELPEGSGIEVFIPVDLLESHKVKHGGIIVKVDDRQLFIETETPSYETINRAMQIGCRALQKLPETPVLAAGFNIRYKIKECPSFLDEITASSLDAKLSDIGCEIVSKALVRRVHLKDDLLKKGILTLSVQKDEKGAIKIELNFHRDSKLTKDLIEWLSISAENLEEQVSSVLSQINVEI